jgi:hypothetical protein
MADVILLKRAAGKGHLTSLAEGTDDAVLSSLVRRTTGVTTLWNEAFTTGITIGGSVQTTGSLFDGVLMDTLTVGAGMGVGDNLTLGGAGSTVTVSGDLVVSGTTVSVDSEVVNIADNHLYLNKDYTTVAAQTGGLVVNYLPTATASTTDTGGFATTSTVNVVDGTAIAAGDFIQVSGAAIAANDGLYEVLSVAAGGDPDIITIDTTPTHSFSQTAFTVDATDTTATITKVTVSAIQSGTDGIWETGAGSTVGALVFTDLASAAGSTLQASYVAGNTISMTDAEGDFDVSVTSGTPAISLDAADASNFTVASGNLTLSTTTSGAIDVTSAGILDLDAAGALSVNSSGGAINVGDDANAQAINIGTAAARTITIGNASATEVQVDALLVDINAGATGMTVDSAAGVAIEADTASTFNVTTGPLTLSTTTSGDLTLSTVTAGNILLSGAAEIDLDAAGLIDINAGANLDIDVTGTYDMLATSTFSIDGTGASNVSATSGNLSLQTVSSGTLILGSAGAVTIDASAANDSGVSIDAFGDSNLTATNTAASTNITQTITVDNTGAIAGDSTLDINATSTNGSGVIDIDADDTITVDTLASGTISIGADAVAGTLNFGTGAAAKTLTIGSLTTTSSLLLQSGATGDITFDGNTMTTPLPFNGTTSGDTGNQDLSSSFTATTLVGVLNELKEAGEADAVISDLITTGLAIGNPVYITTTDDTTAATQADVLATSEAFVGIVRTIGALGTGEVVTSGTASALVEAGLTTTDYPVAGDPVYLSELVAGRVTTIAPSGNPQSGEVIYQIGYVRNDTGLTATTTGASDLLNIELRPGTFIEL